MSAATEVGLQVNRLAIDVETWRLDALLAAAGGNETVTIVCGVNGTPQPLPPPMPAPPPPPPPQDAVRDPWLDSPEWARINWLAGELLDMWRLRQPGAHSVPGDLMDLAYLVLNGTERPQ